MADVDSVVFTEQTRSSKTRKVKKTTKRRESRDQNAEVTITELDSTQNNVNNHNDVGNAIEEYVLADAAALSPHRNAGGLFFLPHLLPPLSSYTSPLCSPLLLLDLDSGLRCARARMPDSGSLCFQISRRSATASWTLGAFFELVMPKWWSWWFLLYIFSKCAEQFFCIYHEL